MRKLWTFTAYLRLVVVVIQTDRWIGFGKVKALAGACQATLGQCWSGSTTVEFVVNLVRLMLKLEYLCLRLKRVNMLLA